MLALALPVYATSTPDSAGAGDGSPLELSRCELRGTGGYVSVNARCGRLAVPENPADPEGRRILLYVAVIPARDPEPESDAFTFLAGGPGQAATTAFADLSRAFARISEKRDIMLVDQRGTGRSAPLECAAEGDLLGMTPTEGQLMADVEACLDSLEGDPRFYTTSAAVEDLDRVREVLGYERLNVYGGSYGTRVGLHYLRRYPERVRTLILDGVVPADLNLGPGIALAAQGALDQAFSRCTGSGVCNERFGDPGVQFEKIAESLRQAPATVTLQHPVDGTPREVVFDYTRFSVAVRLLSYAPESVALLPLLLHQAAADNNVAPLAAQAVMIEASLAEVLSIGMHNSVVCTEDVPFYGDSSIDREALRATYLGESQLSLLETICKVWPAGYIHDDFKAPVASDLPVLLMSGGADPVTPPAYAEQAAATLANHRHLVLEGMGHIQATAGCMPRLIARYVEEASLDALDDACLADVAPMPFFSSFNGPEP